MPPRQILLNSEDYLGITAGFIAINAFSLNVFLLLIVVLANPSRNRSGSAYALGY